MALIITVIVAAAVVLLLQKFAFLHVFRYNTQMSMDVRVGLCAIDVQYRPNAILIDSLTICVGLYFNDLT